MQAFGGPVPLYSLNVLTCCPQIEDLVRSKFPRVDADLHYCRRLGTISLRFSKWLVRVLTLAMNVVCHMIIPIAIAAWRCKLCFKMAYIQSARRFTWNPTLQIGYLQLSII